MQTEERIKDVIARLRLMADGKLLDLPNHTRMTPAERICAQFMLDALVWAFEMEGCEEIEKGVVSILNDTIEKR